MPMKKIETPWASNTANVGSPSTAEIGAGHGLNTVANSSFANFAQKRADDELNEVAELAQGVSQSPSMADGLDWVRLCGGMQHQKVNGTLFPSDDLCTVSLPIGANSVCAGRIPETNRGCVFVHNNQSASIRRLNSWDIGSLAFTELDLDLTNAETAGLRGLACDGDYLYTTYANTVTGNYHIIKLSLANWTGLPVEERDTGWSYASSAGRISIALAQYNKLVAFYQNVATVSFGVWTTDDSSWVTGAGNTGSTTYAIEAGYQHDVQANWNQAYTIVQTDASTSKQYVMVSCDVSNPTNASNPADPVVVQTVSGSSDMVGFRVFNNFAICLAPNGALLGLYNDGTSDWGAISKGTVSSVGLEKSDVVHRPQIVADGSGRVWLLYFVDSTDVNNDTDTLMLVALEPGTFKGSGMIDATATPRAVVPVASGSAALSNLQMVWDGRSLVIFNDPGTSPRYAHVFHNPGAR